MLLLLLLEVTLAFLERLLSIADCLILVDNANWLTTTNCCCCRHANLCALSRFLLFSKEMLVDSRVRSSPRWTGAAMNNDAAAADLAAVTAVSCLAFKKRTRILSPDHDHFHLGLCSEKIAQLPPLFVRAHQCVRPCSK